MAKKRLIDKSANFKLIWLLIIILLLGLATLIFYQKSLPTQKVSNKENPASTRINTSDWITYESPVANGMSYKLKYPSNWEIKTEVGGESNPQPRELSIDLKSLKCESGSSDSIYIKHFLKADPQQAYETIIKQSSDPGKNNIKFKTTYLETANNDLIIKIENPLQKPIPVFNSYKTSNTGVYYVGGGGWCSSDFEKTYDAIISSLEFIN
ncbi:MAG: hypothetical protein KBD51_02950 [Candidatus Levybacteria bacterium]|nr:hypothetical protein [Candidatus Levybacteria bacterium]